MRKLNQTNRWNKAVKKLWSHTVTRSELDFIFNNFSEVDGDIGRFISFVISLQILLLYSVFLNVSHVLDDFIGNISLRTAYALDILYREKYLRQMRRLSVGWHFV